MSGQPGIVSIYFSKVTTEFVMIGMEYCPNGSLEQYISDRNGQKMEENNMKSFSHQILSAMYCYTEKKIVHIDIKSANILIDRIGEIKIADFGLARETNGQSKLPTKSIAGNKRYFSPELNDWTAQSEKGGVWAFRVVLLELAYGFDTYEETSKICGMSSKNVKKQFTERGGYSKEMAQFLRRHFEKESYSQGVIERY